MQHEPAPNLFAIHPWKLEETELDSKTLTLAETLFSVANGYLGTRATFEESVGDNPGSKEGTYLNGVYVREPIHYDEIAYGYASHNNKMVQVPDAKAIRIYIDGQLYVPSHLSAVSHVRSMDFREAVLERTTVWNIDGKRQIEVSTRKVASLQDQHVLAVEYTIKPLGFSADIGIESLVGIGHLPKPHKDVIDPRAGHLTVAKSLTLLETEVEENDCLMLHETNGSGFIIGTACRHVCKLAGNVESDTLHEGTTLTRRFTRNVQDGEAFTLTKYISYHHDMLGKDAKVKAALKTSLDAASSSGFDSLCAYQKRMLQIFWNQAEVNISSDDALQQGIRFNLFHIFQSSGRDGKRAIGAKGITGPGYDGHYFWDTEIYIVPFFIYTAPEVARKLIEYRYTILDAARERARQMDHPRGALFAWRTISGEECSSFFPAGTAQYHINAAVAYAVMQYYHATQDTQFMRECGAELLVETARIWADMGHFSASKGGKFCINEVTGPDEYSAMVDNNFYTNAMARMHLRSALAMVRHLQQEFPEDAARIIGAVGLEESELALWEKAVANMYLPHDETLGISPQDDNFLTKPKWDFANRPEEKYPLLLHYHPLVIYRHQVLKQADVVLAMALLGHEFSPELRRANLNYYTPITTHDSTLSTCIYSIESSRAGLYDQAYTFFQETARMDIDNLHHNTEYGIHSACMAGSWMSIVMGFAGMEAYGDKLHFAPHLPQSWKDYCFRMCFRGAILCVTVNANGTTYELLEGAEAIEIFHYDQEISLKLETPATLAHHLPPLKEKHYA